MKRQTIYFFACLIISSSQAFSQKSYTITGRVAGVPDSTKVYLEKDVISEDYPLDSTYIINGTFCFRGSVPFSMECLINLYDVDSNSQLNFWLDNTNLTITADAARVKEANVKGSKSHESYLQYVKEVKNIVDKLGEHYYSDTATSLTKRFIAKHPNSYKSAQELYLFRERMSANEEKQLYGSLSKRSERL
jgi:hypothetical protein